MPHSRARLLAIACGLLCAILSGTAPATTPTHAAPVANRHLMSGVTAPANVGVQYAEHHWTWTNWDHNSADYCDINGYDLNTLQCADPVGAPGSCSGNAPEVPTDTSHLPYPCNQPQYQQFFQPHFQCAEFVARALAAEGLIPGLGPDSPDTSYQDFTYFGTSYPLGNVGSLYDFLTQSGRGYNIQNQPANAVPGDLVFYGSLEHVTIIIQAGSTVGGSDTTVDSHNTDNHLAGYYAYGTNVTIVHVNADAGSMPTRVANEQNGAMDIFARGTDSAFWHIWQTGPNSGWNTPTSLGGVLPSSTPAVAENLDGSLQVFGRGSDGAMWYNAQAGPNGGWNGGWISLGGLFGGDAAEAISRDGRVEIFAPNRNGTMYTAWQNCPGNGCGWSGWSVLGNPAGVALQTTAAARNLAGPLEVFSIGSDNGLWHDGQTCAGCGWSGWSSLGGIVAGTPAVAESIDGRLEVFARTSAGAMWTLWQNCPGNGCGWSGWSTLGNPSGVSLGDPAVVRSQDGRFELFAAGSDGAIWTIWQSCHGCGWSGWASLGKPSGIGLGEAAAARSFYGELEVYGRGSDGAMWTAWQTCVGCGWTGWPTLGGSFA